LSIDATVSAPAGEFGTEFIERTELRGLTVKTAMTQDLLISLEFNELQAIHRGR